MGTWLRAQATVRVPLPATRLARENSNDTTATAEGARATSDSSLRTTPHLVCLDDQVGHGV